MKVVGLGQCCLDMLAVVDPYPAANEKTEVLMWQEQSGGPVATALRTLCRLGVACEFFGIIGDDPEGERIRQKLSAAGMDVRGLFVRPGRRSQVAFIVVEKRTGNRTIFWRRAEGEELRAEELPEDFLDSCDFLHLDGLMEDISVQASKMAQKKGISVMLDAGRLRDRSLEIARHSDFLVASELFLQQTGWNRSDFQRRIRDLGVRVATITLGERGSITYTQEGDCFEIPSYQVDVVDTTGAGDVFHGAYVYGLLQNWDLRQVIRFASATAALKCTRIGGSAGIPTLEEILRFMQERQTSLR